MPSINIAKNSPRDLGEYIWENVRSRVSDKSEFWAEFSNALLDFGVINEATITYANFANQALIIGIETDLNNFDLDTDHPFLRKHLINLNLTPEKSSFGNLKVRGNRVCRLYLNNCNVEQAKFNGANAMELAVDGTSTLKNSDIRKSDIALVLHGGNLNIQGGEIYDTDFSRGTNCNASIVFAPEMMTMVSIQKGLPNTVAVIGSVTECYLRGSNIVDTGAFFEKCSIYDPELNPVWNYDAGFGQKDVRQLAQDMQYNTYYNCRVRGNMSKPTPILAGRWKSCKLRSCEFQIRCVLRDSQTGEGSSYCLAILEDPCNVDNCRIRYMDDISENLLPDDAGGTSELLLDDNKLDQKDLDLICSTLTAKMEVVRQQVHVKVARYKAQYRNSPPQRDIATWTLESLIKLKPGAFINNLMWDSLWGTFKNKAIPGERMITFHDFKRLIGQK